MKNILLSLSAFIAVFAILLIGCNKNEEAADTTMPRPVGGAAKFVLRVGFDAEFPPYGFRDEDGNLVGFDLDLAKEVAKRRGWGIELKPIDWDAKDAELNSGTINCIWNGFTINGREELYTWTEPYVDNSQVVLVKNSNGIKALADLAGRVVEAQADSSGLAAINDEEHAELKAGLKKVVEVPNFNQAFMELEAGVCDAVVVDEGVALSFIKDHAADFSILEETLKSEQYGVGFKLGNEELRDQVQETLNEMIEDGTFKTISEKWFDGKDVTIRK